MKSSLLFSCGTISLTEQFDGEGHGCLILMAGGCHNGDAEYSYTVEYNTFAERKQELAIMLRQASNMILMED